MTINETEVLRFSSKVFDDSFIFEIKDEKEESICYLLTQQHKYTNIYKIIKPTEFITDNINYILHDKPDLGNFKTLLKDFYSKLVTNESLEEASNNIRYEGANQENIPFGDTRLKNLDDYDLEIIKEKCL